MTCDGTGTETIASDDGPDVVACLGCNNCRFITGKPHFKSVRLDLFGGDHVKCQLELKYTSRSGSRTFVENGFLYGQLSPLISAYWCEKHQIWVFENHTESGMESSILGMMV